MRLPKFAIVRRCVIVLCLLVVSIQASAQVSEYDWYPEFRRWMQASVPSSQRGAALQERYRAKLQTEGVAAAEIERRLTLLRTKRQELENDFWNRFFTLGQSTFNTEPNQFLAATVEGRKPGKALDVGMGEGRNALFLARLGWDVTGFDPADQAVALAQSRAAALKLTLHTSNALDTTFDFGRDQWDLIVYSWVQPVRSLDKVVASLRPAGIIVFEGARAWFPPNTLLQIFQPLRVVHYEEVKANSDFFNRSEMDIVRLVVEKADAPPAANTEQDLRALRRELMEASAKGDRVALERILAPDFMFIHSTGTVETRQQYVDRCVKAAGTAPAPAFDYSDETIRYYGNTAVWTTRSVRRQPGAEPVTFRGTDVLIRRGAGWQWVSVHSVRLPANQ